MGRKLADSQAVRVIETDGEGRKLVREGGGEDARIDKEY
jgi:hypothetical protein